MKKSLIKNVCALCVILTLFLTNISTPILIYAEEATSTTSTEASSAPIEATTTSVETSSVSVPDTDAETSATSTDSGLITPEATSSVATTTPALTQDMESASTTMIATSTSDLFPGPYVSTSTELGTTTQDMATTTIDMPGSGAVMTNTSSSTQESMGTSTPDIAPTILSGESVAMLNILNILNSSFLNSTGSIIFSNLLGQSGSVDLRNASLFSGMCNMLICEGSQTVNWNMWSDATITNDLKVNAITGNNYVNATDTASIKTGDAYAGVNLVNLANSTFIDSNYLLVALNAFKGVNGDIVFPSLDKFLNGTSSNITNGNFDFMSAAHITNDIAANSNTGDNSIATGSQSVLKTGTAKAYANIYNQVNSSLPGNGISILFRISGAWNGKLVNAPAGFKVIHGLDGSMYLLMQSNPGSSGNSSSPDVNFTGTSTASIDNHVSANALTGSNSIDTASSTLISTGNAYAGANIINIANQNVIGKNWLLAVINIFGDFNGDIAFGRPDLWVGDKVSGPTMFETGNTLSYKITVINNGDADATGVKLTENFDKNRVSIATSSLPFDVISDDTISWTIGDLPKGKAVEITYDAKVKDATVGTSITNTSKATLVEKDNNYDDNSDSVTITSVYPPGSGSVYYPPSAFQNPPAPTETFPIITFSREPAEITLSREATSTSEHIVLKNESDTPAHNVTLRDTLVDPSGDDVHQEEYILGDVKPHEEIWIDYDIAFSHNAPSGTYVLKTNVDGGNIANRTIPNGKIILLPYPAAGQVLGTSTPKIVHVKITKKKVSSEPTEEATSTATTTRVAFITPNDVSGAVANAVSSHRSFSWYYLFFGLSLSSVIGYGMYGGGIMRRILSVMG